MAAFFNVLEDVERSFQEIDRPISSPSFGFAASFAPGDCHAATTSQALAAYRSFQNDPPAPPNMADREWFARSLAQAARSAKSLEALRRQAAWRLHPDRVPACGDVAAISLAEINAAIDAALFRCPRAKR